MAYDFDKQYQVGEEGEQVLDKFFRTRFYIKNASSTDQHNGTDRFFVSTSTGKRYSVEYKTDALAASTGNVFIETVSVDTSETRGWAYTSCAQVLIYYIPPEALAYMVPMMDIKRLIRDWEDRFTTKCVPNNGYNTMGIAVPRTVFEADCHLAEERELWIDSGDVLIVKGQL